MRLVASPVLSQDDVLAIREGYRQREEVISESLLRSLEVPVPDPVRDRLHFLAWLISEGRLDIKIAVVDDDRGFGIYHEKTGIFLDEEKNYVVFTGSANESIGGLISNFESIDVYRSWIPADQERIGPKLIDFENLWHDRTQNLHVLPFPDAARRALIQLRPDQKPTKDPEEDASYRVIERSAQNTPQIPETLQLRQYQKDAVRAWFTRNGRGTWRMATGTGKTITVLALVAHLYRTMRQHERPLVVIVLCPFQHLVTQWSDEARRFGIDPVLCFQSRDLWFPKFMSRIVACDLGQLDFTMAIVTNATFQGQPFQEALGRIRFELLVIADEVHNVGSPRLRDLLPDSADYRLALSATPERWYDEAGTQAIFDYFGPVVFEIDLAEAIRVGALTKYQYCPQLVNLTSEELEQYVSITEQISRIVATGSDDAELQVDGADGQLKRLLIRRARLLASAGNKLSRLRGLMEPLRESSHNLVYCGDGRTQYLPEMEDIRQLDATVHLLGRDLRMSVNSYTAETYLDDRADLRQRFARGELQALVAIRCLDEGVDIPET